MTRVVIHRRVLDLLREGREMSAAEMSAALGDSVSVVISAARFLVGRGDLERVVAVRKGRKVVKWRAAEAATRGGTQRGDAEVAEAGRQ